MVFSSTLFLFLFLPITLLLYFNPIWKSRVYRNGILLLISIGFYAWGEPVFLFVLLFSIVFQWGMALLIDAYSSKKSIRHLCVTASLFFQLGLLFIYKYLVFVCENLNFLMKKEFFTISIALPIGISFFTFQILSYVLDVYYGKVKVQKNLLNVALYVFMFPQLIAGPIVRYETVAGEIENRCESREEVTAGIERFIIGLAKKVLLANYFGIITDNIFILFENGNISITLAWLGAIAYTLQIYFDFSAYSDMAIGLGRIFGFHFEENFRYPYIAASVNDFWRRWHISLSTWFRDYVYIPLGGNRVSMGKHIRNIFIVWLLTGIWHGANWTFIVWGLLYFIILVLEKKTGFAKRLGIFAHVYTLLVVILAWVIFRANSIQDAIAYFAAMFGIRADGFIDDVFIEYFSQAKWLLLAGVLSAVPTAKWLQKKLNSNQKVYEWMRAVGVLVIFLITIAVMVKSTYNPFIYFNF